MDTSSMMRHWQACQRFLDHRLASTRACSCSLVPRPRPTPAKEWTVEPLTLTAARPVDAVKKVVFCGSVSFR